MGLQDQVQQHEPGASGVMWVQPSTECQFLWKLLFGITFHILLQMVLHFGYSAKTVTAETTFLYGDLEEEIYMECPQGKSNIKKDKCIILNKWIYGLVQSARQYYKKAVKILKNLGFVGGNVDPCLYAKKSAKGIVYIALYIDDNLMIGNMMAIDDAILALNSNGLVLKIVEELQDYLPCEIKFSDDKKRAWLGQLHLIKIGKEIWQVHAGKFGVTRLQVCLNFLTMRPMINSEKISAKDQQEYWSFVGMLLYLVKH